MRRSERKLTDKTILHSIILKSKICRIAMSLNNIPYIIPAHFGFKDEVIYIHSAKTGKKIEILTQNKNVCIEMDILNEIIKSERPCNWSTNYQCVICFGKVEFIEDNNEKIEALKIIMEHYSPNNEYIFQKASIDKLIILKIKLDKITGKHSLK